MSSRVSLRCERGVIRQSAKSKGQRSPRDRVWNSKRTKSRNVEEVLIWIFRQRWECGCWHMDNINWKNEKSDSEKAVDARNNRTGNYSARRRGHSEPSEVGRPIHELGPADLRPHELLGSLLLSNQRAS